MNCPSDPEMRAVFGCDEPALDPTEVPALQGEEMVRLDRCPNFYVDQSTREVILTWRRVEKHGIWPVEGGQDAQSASFLEAVDFLDGEAARYQEEQRQRLARR